MSAMEMMLKSFGLDPEAIKTQVEKAGSDFKDVVASLHNRFDALEAKIDKVLELHQIDLANAPQSKKEGE